MPVVISVMTPSIEDLSGVGDHPGTRYQNDGMTDGHFIIFDYFGTGLSNLNTTKADAVLHHFGIHKRVCTWIQT